MFSTEFMGLGPYRLDHHRGRPPLDRVIVRFIPDANALVANVLSGGVDVVLPTGVVLLLRTMWTRELRALAEGRRLKDWRYSERLVAARGT